MSKEQKLGKRHLDWETTTPSLKYLYEYITPKYAADWKVLGTLLGLPSGELKAIETEWPTNVKWCCNQMLQKWLETDPTASREKLLATIESPALKDSTAHEMTNALDTSDWETTTPLLKYLYEYITPQYAKDWKVLGTLLGLPSGEVNAIETGYPTNVKWCCNQMLEKWLEMDPTASREKLLAAIKSLKHSPTRDSHEVTNALDRVEALSNTVSDIYIQTHLQIDEEAWPPMHPKRFTPLVLIQYKGEHNLKQSTTMAEIIEQGHLDEIAYGTTSDMVPNCKRLKLGSHKALQEIFETSRITKEIVKILTPLEKSNEPQFILIEGAPGIGKSLLLKHIGYLWGKKKIMQKFKLVLLVCLRDPAVQKMSKVNDLLQLFCRRHREAEQVVSTCSDYLTQTNGKDVAFLFDGYDEYPKMLQKDSLIADILKRKVLPNCGLIVSSRPHASVNLRGQATVKADILGFAESEREDYIKEALENQPQKIHELTQYLQNHSIISSLCFVPFNMVVLVYMYKKGNPLPKNSAELYSYFVCLTICRHLIKHGQYLSSNIIKLTDLPEPCYKIVQQLSKLSLEALTDNKLVFTFDEINAACPDITGVNGEINAFGLLHVVEHFELTGVTKTFNFLHFSIQEYLAANYITSLPADEELKIIEKKFWSSSHFNMFSIYIALTMGQRPSFKQFLSGKNKMTAISDDFLNDQLLCLRLYHCFYEAGDDNICKAIQQSKIFNDKEIDLNSVVLEPYDVECITVFLTSSSQNKWMELDMCKCFIQDHGLRILYHGLCRHGDVTINKLWLDNNGLTMQSFFLISEITVKCEVKELGISNNNIIDYQQLYSMLTHPFTSLEILNMQITKLSSEKAISLFNALRDNKKLRTLIVTNNAISDDVSDAIIAALQKNVCLDTLAMNSNPITGEAMEHIVNGAKGNNTLQQLMLPRCPEDIKKRIISLQEHINEMRENQGIQIKLSILFSS